MRLFAGAAWPREPDDRFGHMVCDESSSFFFFPSADFTDHHDDIRLRVALKVGRTSLKLVPMMGSPPIPTQVLVPIPALFQSI